MKVRSGRKPNMSREQYRRVVEVRTLRARTPSNKELARELGVSLSVIHKALADGLRTYEEVQP
jgi:DNA-directed RNA polymerase specialized sigma24 family protein